MQKFQDRAVSPETFFLFVSFTFGLSLIFLTPPMQIPDENFHFYRSFSLSQGNWLPKKRGNLTGDSVPKSIVEFTQLSLFPLRLHPDHKFDTLTRKKVFGVAWPTDETQFVGFSNAGLYFPLGYLLTSLPMALSNWIALPPWILFYLGRLFNFLAATFLIYLALKMLKTGGWLIAIYALTPMNLFLRASLSLDAMLISLTIVFCCLCVGGDRLPIQRRLWLIFGIGFFFSLLKSVYLPLLGLTLALPVTLKKRVFFTVGLLITSLIGNLLWLTLMAPLSSATIFGNNAHQQLQFVLSSPIDTMWMLLFNYFTHWMDYIRMFIGQLGWLEFYLPHWIWCSYAGVLLFSALSEPLENALDSISRRLLYIAIFLMGLLTIALAIFITGMPAGNTTLVGLQGRYFIPCALPLFFALTPSPKEEGRFMRYQTIFYVAYGSLVNLATLYAMAKRYYPI